MSPDASSVVDFSPHEFQDLDDCVIVKLFANGVIEQKDLDILIESDSLEVYTPTNEKWSFQLFDHVHRDQMEVKTKVTETRTQTAIELRLHKQNGGVSWPQLCSHQSTLQKKLHLDIIDQQSHSSFQEHHFEISIKKLTTDFTETMDNKGIVQILIKQVNDCQVQFTETNFTTIFYTKDEDFLRTHSISSKTPVKLFVRVKERIKPNQCTYITTPTYIEITLIKDGESGNRWYRLEPNEYSEYRPLIPTSSSSISPLPLTYTSSIINNNDKAIPLLGTGSIDRQSDKYSSGSAFHSKEIRHSISPTAIGYTGIFNPANSCFMNAALQCLSNTRELRDYFLKSYHYVELNRTNPLGMQGIMAEEFASVIKSLWSGQTSCINANRFREYAAKRHQEFVGNGQHDAQELLTVVLDAIHEDLNRVMNKPQVPPVEDSNRLDDVIADEYWRGYLSRNDSIVVQLFTGQFKSKTKCPQCNKESVTFDPFTSLSVPVPKRVAIDIIVTYRTDERPPMKYRVTMSADGTIGDLKRLLSHKCGLSITKMLAYKISYNRSIEYQKDEDLVPSSTYAWNNDDLIYITEILTRAECDNQAIVHLTFFQRIFKLPDFVLPCAYCQAPPTPQSSPKFCKNCYRVSYCDQHCQKFHENDHKYACGSRSADNYENIGLPFIISLPESQVTCKNVFEQIRICAKRSVDIHIEQSKQTQRSIPSNLELDDYGVFIENEEEDSFSDIENVDWSTIKSTLSSSDSWSICRIGDYFMKISRTERRRRQKRKHQEEGISNLLNGKDDESMAISGDSGSESGTEDFDMLDDIYGSQPLFRIMPQLGDSFNSSINEFQPIIEYGDDADQILRHHTTFSIDWFTDNKSEAPLRVTPSKHRTGINSLVEDESVSKATTGDQDITLQQCLQLFIEPEVLGPDDKWYCPHCKEHIQAEKRMSVWRLPPILIIHLKRFKYNQSSSYGYMSNTREKIESTVKFPIHNLDMGPYCSSISGGHQNQDQNNSSQSPYDLYGVINHRGTAWFGHYTSYGRLLANNDPAKTEIDWRQFDDERVSNLFNVKDIVRSDAYVLFYRHRHLAVNFSLQERVLVESNS